MENLGSNIPRATVEKGEKNQQHGSHFQPSYCHSAQTPLRLLLTDTENPCRCFGVVFENYSHNNINQRGKKKQLSASPCAKHNYIITCCLYRKEVV